MDAPQPSEFWGISLNKVFWLGVAFVGILGVNTILDLTEKDPKTTQDSTLKEKKPTCTIPSSTSMNNAARGDGEVRVQSLKMKIDDVPSKNERDPHLTVVKSIVFTGGPCGGKTTALSQVCERLKDLGYAIVCVPEAATLIFSSGGDLRMDGYSALQAIEFQKCLMSLQINLEEIFKKIVTINPNSNTVFALCDRGLMDGSAYLPKEQWDVLLNEMGFYEAEIKVTRYDMVVHLTTAADGAESFYTLANNKARNESVSQAIDLDQRIRKAWLGHPKYLLVTNDCKNFSAKIQVAEDFILKEQGHPTDSRFTKKYLLTNNGLFDKVVSNYKLEVFNLTDTFMNGVDSTLESSDGSNEEYFVRKRENNSRLSFMHGRRVHQGSKVLLTVKRNIPWKEYCSIIESHKTQSTAVFRRRCMALLGSMYLNFDEFNIKGVKFIIMMIQANEKFNSLKLEEQITYIKENLPAYVTQNILQEVTDHVSFRLSEMAKPRWTLPSELADKLNRYSPSLVPS